MEGGLGPPFLRHCVVTMRCKIWTERGILQFRAYAPPSVPFPPGRGPWPLAQPGLATVSSKSEDETNGAGAVRPRKLSHGVGALLRGAIASHAKPREADQHQRPGSRLGNRGQRKGADSKSSGVRLNSP